MSKQEILSGVVMAVDADTDGGQVSRDSMPVERARQLAVALEDAGHESSWAPDAEDSSVAYLYVR
jgi:hypothetical protein